MYKVGNQFCIVIGLPPIRPRLSSAVSALLRLHSHFLLSENWELHSTWWMFVRNKNNNMHSIHNSLLSANLLQWYICGIKTFLLERNYPGGLKGRSGKNRDLNLSKFRFLFVKATLELAFLSVSISKCSQWIGIKILKNQSFANTEHFVLE